MNKVKKNIKPTVHHSAPVEKVTTIEKKSNKQGFNKGILFFIIILVVLASLLFRKLSQKNGFNNMKTNIIPSAVKKVINNPATKFEIGKITDTSGVYEFELVLKSGADQKYNSYITKDGKILFVSGIKVDTLGKTAPTAQTQAQTKKLTCNDLTKVDNTKLTAYVVADCPFGLQMQRVIKKTIDEQPALSNNIDVKYIGAIENGKITSMHGDKEAQENLRQICIREEQKANYWDYVGCYMKEGKSEECLTSTGINATQLKSCVEDKTKGLVYAQKDFDTANKYQIGSSPTLLLNDKQTVSEFDFGGRIPNAMKELVCCSSTQKGAYCDKDLSKTEVASSYSITGESTNQGTGNAANCGTP